jgi:uncharacterized protein DUF6766
MKKIWRNYGLGIIIFALFVVSWCGQYMTHDKSIGDFWNATFENWQSEFLQVAVFVILTKYFIYKGSPQSRDGDDELKMQLNRIEKKLDESNR